MVQSEGDGETPRQQDLPFDAGDPKQVKERVREARMKERDRDDFLRNVLASKEGREWFYDTLAESGVFANAFATDPHVTAFNCGQQNMGRYLLAEVMRAAPERYLEMLKEVNDDRSKRS